MIKKLFQLVIINICKDYSQQVLMIEVLKLDKISREKYLEIWKVIMLKNMRIIQIIICLEKKKKLMK